MLRRLLRMCCRVLLGGRNEIFSHRNRPWITNTLSNGTTTQSQGTTKRLEANADS